MTGTVRAGNAAHSRMNARVVAAVAYLSVLVGLGIVLPVVLLFVTRKGTTPRAHVARALSIQLAALFLIVLALLLMPIVTSIGGSAGTAMDVYGVAVGLILVVVAVLSIAFAVGALLDARWSRPAELPIPLWRPRTDHGMVTTSPFYR